MTETLPVLRKSVTVPVSPRQAFEIFTDRMAEWWPLESHSLSASEGKTALGVTLTPRAGGRVTETRHDGNPAEWGTITQWDDGKSLTLDWYVGRSPSQATRIAVTFLPADSGTEVQLEHTGFERLGVAGEAAAANYEEGWDLVLGECFRGACEARV